MFNTFASDLEQKRCTHCWLHPCWQAWVQVYKTSKIIAHPCPEQLTINSVQVADACVSHDSIKFSVCSKHHFNTRWAGKSLTDLIYTRFSLSNQSQY